MPAAVDPAEGPLANVSTDGLSQLEPVAREPTASVIARRIRNAIIDGVLAPGTQLTEMRLAEQLGVSRAPVREALQRLIQEGLAQNRRRGVFVRELTVDDVADVYFARAACELAAAERIMSRSADVDWEPLDEALRWLEEATAATDWSQNVRADRHFHETLVAAAGSERLTRMFGTLMAETAICLRRLEGQYHDFDQLVDEHREILAALRDADHERAIQAFNAHTADALRRLGPPVDDHLET